MQKADQSPLNFIVTAQEYFGEKSPKYSLPESFQQYKPSFKFSGKFLLAVDNDKPNLSAYYHQLDANSHDEKLQNVE